MQVEQELNGIVKNGIGNFDDLPRLVHIDKKSGNLKLESLNYHLVDGGKLTSSIQKKKKPDLSQVSIL